MTIGDGDAAGCNSGLADQKKRIDAQPMQYTKVVVTDTHVSNVTKLAFPVALVGQELKVQVWRREPVQPLSLSVYVLGVYELYAIQDEQVPVVPLGVEEA